MFFIFRFLKAKVTILQQELNLSHQENVKNLDNLSKSMELQKKTEAARCQANNTINTLNAQLQKLQQNEMNMTLKLKVCYPPYLLNRIFLISFIKIFIQKFHFFLF